MTVELPPLPWRVLEPDEYVEADRCRGIVDARGVPVVTTDSGVYDPGLATAYFIVRAMNNHEALLAALKEVVPPVPPKDAHCHNGICEQEQCVHCGRILNAHRVIAQVEAR